MCNDLTKKKLEATATAKGGTHGKKRALKEITLSEKKMWTLLYWKALHSAYNWKMIG